MIFFLQIYRTVNLFLFKKRNISKAEEVVSGYEYYSNKKYDEDQDVNLDKLVFLVGDLLEDFPELDNEIKINNQTLLIKPFSKKISLDVSILYKKINILFPVAIQQYFDLMFEDKCHVCLVLVVPSKTGTSITILCHHDVVDQVSYMLASKIRILNLIEAIIMSDADFYIDPTVFDHWSDDRFKLLVEDFYFFSERDFLKEYDMSIFDDIRKTLCLGLEEKERVCELKKIHDIPCREDFSERNEKMLSSFASGRYKKRSITRSR